MYVIDTTEKVWPVVLQKTCFSFLKKKKNNNNNNNISFSSFILILTHCIPKSGFVLISYGNNGYSRVPNIHVGIT